MTIENKDDTSIDNEWKLFMEGGWKQEDDKSTNSIKEVPKCGDIYISTKTKIVYLDSKINLMETFWSLDIMPYDEHNTGIIKKQMKFNSINKDDVKKIEENLMKYETTHSLIIQSIDNPTGRIKFKDIRKVTVGLCKKDLINCRTKERGAFYNCFVIILRINMESKFSEYHVKVFNTGKLEIPGIKNDKELNLILKYLLCIFKSKLKMEINILEEKMETVLINSNFDCGYYLNRDALFNILKTKYSIQSVFDPCSYPGIQSRIFYDINNSLCKNTGVGKVSFMIFRTGSVLIVGKCDEDVLIKIYEFIKDILYDEFKNIYEMDKPKMEKIIGKKKIKKNIMIN
tara:strand:+ start:4733 stop:5761 length:1029 start_codon:yes stop_codon:yes gene_type:complete